MYRLSEFEQSYHPGPIPNPESNRDTSEVRSSESIYDVGFEVWLLSDETGTELQEVYGLLYSPPPMDTMSIMSCLLAYEMALADLAV